MYDDYRKQRESLYNIELFPTPQEERVVYTRPKPIPQRKKQVKRKPQQKQQRRPQTQTRPKNNYKQMNNTLNAIHKQGKNTHSVANEMLGMFTNLTTLVAVIALGILGAKSYLDNLNNADMEKNAYGGEDTGETGMSTGRTSEKGIQDILQYEGFRSEAYKIKGEKYWTIGYGHSGPDVKPGDTITKEQAFELFKNDLKSREASVRSLVKVPITQNMFDALVSFVYNCGHGNFQKSDTLKLLNQGKYKEAATRMQTEYINKGTGTEKGLRSRRQKEAAKILGDLDTQGQITQTVLNPNKLGNITEAKQTKNGVRYRDDSNITSRTLLTEGTNDKYNANAGGLGTFDGYQITSGIGKRDVAKGSSFHRGLDLKFVSGTPVKAFTSGEVTFAGNMSGFGRCVIINDKNRYRHVYGHLSKISVSNGQKVKKGQVIGHSGGSTYIDGKLYDNYFDPHLHYGIWMPGKTSDRAGYIDPRTYTYPIEEDEIVKTESQNDVVKKGDKAPQPTTKKPSTQNPTTTQKKQQKQTKTQPQKQQGGTYNIQPSNKKQSKSNKIDIGNIDHVGTRVKHEDRRYKKS